MNPQLRKPVNNCDLKKFLHQCNLTVGGMKGTWDQAKGGTESQGRTAGTTTQ